MNVKAFILSLLERPMGYITWDDRLFIFDILQDYKSAYAMHKMKEGIYKEKKLSDPDNAEYYKPLAYININKRFRKLHSLGILEEETITGGFRHGARNYKVSEKGLIFLIADNIHPDIYENFKYFSQSQLFQTFIFPYFAPQTLNQCTLSLARFIEYYLIDICIKINNALNPDLLEEYQYNTKLPLSQQFDLENYDPEEDPSYIITPIFDLLIQLETTHKSLILDLASLNEKILNIKTIKPLDKDKIKTIQLLSKDKIFMNEFKKIKAEIDNSYNKLLNI